jgi:hypothetical protein
MPDYKLYKYTCKITYDIPIILYKYKERFLEQLDMFNIDYIEELSLYEMNERIFTHPCFSGNYNFDFENGTYTFTHHYYDESNDKLDYYKQFTNINDWSIHTTGEDWFDFCDEIMMENLEYTVADRTIKITKFNFSCDEDDFNDYVY